MTSEIRIGVLGNVDSGKSTIIGVLSNGMILEGVSSFWQRVIMGTIIVLAVMIDQLQTRFISKD